MTYQILPPATFSYKFVKEEIKGSYANGDRFVTSDTQRENLATLVTNVLSKQKQSPAKVILCIRSPGLDCSWWRTVFNCLTLGCCKAKVYPEDNIYIVNVGSENNPLMREIAKSILGPVNLLRKESAGCFAKQDAQDIVEFTFERI